MSPPYLTPFLKISEYREKIYGETPEIAKQKIIEIKSEENEDLTEYEKGGTE